MDGMTDSIRRGVEQAYASTIAFLPRLAAFVLILLVGFLIARLINRLLTRGLQRGGFDRLVERGSVKKAVERSGHKVSDVVGTVVYYTIFLFVLQLAFGVFGPNPISTLLTRAITYMPNVFVAITILVVAGMVATAVREIVEASLGGLSYGRIVAGTTSIAIIVLAVFAALSQLGIAEKIVDGIFYAVLAAVVGSIIVSVGGGGIVPMRERWERTLTRLDAEPARLQQAVVQETPSPSAAEAVAGPEGEANR